MRIRKIFIFAALELEVAVNIVAVTAGVLTPAKIIDITVSLGARESSIAAPADETLVAIILLLEAPVVTSEMRQLIVQLAPVILGEASASNG